MKTRLTYIVFKNSKQTQKDIKINKKPKREKCLQDDR